MICVFAICFDARIEGFQVHKWCRFSWHFPVHFPHLCPTWSSSQLELGVWITILLKSLILWLKRVWRRHHRWIVHLRNDIRKTCFTSTHFSFFFLIEFQSPSNANCIIVERHREWEKKNCNFFFSFSFLIWLQSLSLRNWLARSLVFTKSKIRFLRDIFYATIKMHLYSFCMRFFSCH